MTHEEYIDIRLRNMAHDIWKRGFYDGCSEKQKQIHKLLDNAKSEILQGANKAYNADFSMGCGYAVGVIEKYMEELNDH